MKFADKLFLTMTITLTIIFTLFGMMMLSSYFSKTLNREMEQAEARNQMFQLLFEMGYQSVSEYGEDYAIRSAADSAASGVETSEIHCFVWTKTEEYYGNTVSTSEQFAQLQKMSLELEGKENYAGGIRQVGSRYYLLSVCKSPTNEETVCLGISKDVSELYEDRQELLNQYRGALLLLLILGGGCIYGLSRYMTRPIRKLDVVAKQIADGNYEKRSDYAGGDEIGTLAGSFNRMADRLMEQLHRTEEEARQKELEAKQKESFTTAFAHELKTPLTSIIGYADMLNSVPMSEEERSEAYYYIYSQGKRLESLSHKLLELFSMEQTPLQTRPVQMKELEDTICAAMRPVFLKKKVKGRIIFEKGIINGDRELLLSAFYNLLDNAVKAVEEGGCVMIKGTALEQGYEVKVIDNGRGIPEEEIHRITEAFYMVDKSRSRKEGGAGIGMALCQKIINLHQGKMEILSRMEVGTVVRIVFPKELREDAEKK